MARTTVVEAFRGQRKCQHEGCEASKFEHGGELDHEFTQTPLRCEKCGKDIEIGMGYKHVSPRAHRAARGFRKIRCMECPGWRQSELTSSPVLQVVYGGQEAASDALGQLTRPQELGDVEGVLSDVMGIVEEMAEQATEASEMRFESADAIEDGFGHETEQSATLRDEGDALESWSSDLENLTLEEFAEEDTDELLEGLDDWFDAVVGVADEEIGASPL